MSPAIFITSRRSTLPEISAGIAMNLFKSYVTTGLFFLDHHTADFESWGRVMIREFGSGVHDHLPDIHHWSLLLASLRDGPRPGKMNCWEFMSCGKEFRGDYTGGDGTCPAARESRLDGIHGGMNGGRSCWVVDGTSCGGTVGGTHNEKRPVCESCAFFLSVNNDEGEMFFLPDDLLISLLR